MMDIAQSLGISKSTVSKALNGAPDISETTRNTIVQRAVEMGYTRGRRSPSLPRICIFVMHMRYETPEDFGYDIVMGFRHLAEPAGFRVDIINLDEGTQQSIQYDEYMLRNDYRGAFFLGINNSDPWIDSVKGSHTATILFDNPTFENHRLTQVGVDNTEALNLAVSHLWQLGHRRIGYLSSGSADAYIYQQRHHAFIAAIQQYTADVPITGAADYTTDCISTHLPRLLDSGCTAIVCNHDILAQAVLTHCAETGIRVPEDVSVIGYDDIPLCQFTRPPLTTVRQNRLQLGKSAFYALQCQLNNTPINQLTLHAELTVRGSTGPAKA
ncbi:MAG: LacI family DNA-binding transcriptional regulator [Clostridia bacterium]|nr:LacI family DNA-binding transcriptional regulator [Clostridia bacterium]